MNVLILARNKNVATQYQSNQPLDTGEYYYFDDEASLKLFLFRMYNEELEVVLCDGWEEHPAANTEIFKKLVELVKGKSNQYKSIW